MIDDDKEHGITIGTVSEHMGVDMDEDSSIKGWALKRAGCETLSEGVELSSRAAANASHRAQVVDSIGEHNIVKLSATQHFASATTTNTIDLH